MTEQYPEDYYESKSLGRCADGTYLMLEWGYLKDLCPLDAVVLTFLKNKHRSLKDTHQIREDGWFFCTAEEMEYYLRLNYKAQRIPLNRLKDLGFLDIAQKGAPSKRHFKLNFQALDKIEGYKPFLAENMEIWKKSKKACEGVSGLPKTEFPEIPDSGDLGSPDSGYLYKRNTGKGIQEKSDISKDISIAVNKSPLEKDSEIEETVSQPSKNSNPQSKKLIPNNYTTPVPERVLLRILEMSDYFSQMRLEVKPFKKNRLAAEKVLNQIKCGTFVRSTKWKKGYLKEKIEQFKGFPLADEKGEMTWPQVIETLQQAVTAWHQAVDGGFEWPKIQKNGKRAKVGLDAFLLNQAPQGTTSPFLGFLVGSGQRGKVKTHEDVKKALHPKIQEIGQKILDDRLGEKGKSWGEVGLKKWWEGIANLVMWRNSVADRIEACDVSGGNARHLNNSFNMMKLIYTYFAGDDPMIGQQAYPSWEFIGPEINGWRAFRMWAKHNFDITLDLTESNARLKQLGANPYNSPDHRATEIREELIANFAEQNLKLGKDYTEKDLDDAVQNRLKEEENG